MPNACLLGACTLGGLDVQVKALEGHRVVEGSCGGTHTMVVTDEGRCFIWGRGAFGRCGAPPMASRLLQPALLGLVCCSGPSLRTPLLLLVPAKPVARLPANPSACNATPPMQAGHGRAEGLHLTSRAQAAGGARALARHQRGCGGPPLHGAGPARQWQPGAAAGRGEVPGCVVPVGMGMGAARGQRPASAKWLRASLATCVSATSPLISPTLASPALLLQWSVRKPYYSPSPPQSTLGRDASWPVLGEDEHEDGGGAPPPLPLPLPLPLLCALELLILGRIGRRALR